MIVLEVRDDPHCRTGMFALIVSFHESINLILHFRTGDNALLIFHDHMLSFTCHKVDIRAVGV